MLKMEHIVHVLQEIYFSQGETCEKMESYQ